MTLYECGVRYNKTADNGMTKKVTELYLVDACSFAEAEARIIGELSYANSSDIDVTSIKRTNYSKIVGDSSFDDKWFKAKLVFASLDEKSGKVKKQAVYFIVNASDINKAHSSVVEHMAGSVMDYEIATLDETKIIDLIRYKVNASDNG